MMSDRTTSLIGKAELSEKIAVIREIITERLLNRLGGIDSVPDALSYIVDEVSIARFNMIGSEGAYQHDIEGELLRWDDLDLFAPYEKDIEAYLERTTSGRGKVRFL